MAAKRIQITDYKECSYIREYLVSLDTADGVDLVPIVDGVMTVHVLSISQRHTRLQ